MLKLRRLIAVGISAAAALSVAAAASGAATASAVSTHSASRASGGCGTVPYVAPDDSSGVLTKLHLSSQATGFYEGWPTPIGKSAWANWVPKHKGKLKIAIVGGVVVNAFYAEAQADLVHDLKASSLVNPNITVTAPASFTAIAQQLQQYNAAVQQHANLIIFDPISPTAAQAAVVAAGKKGIPTVSIFNTINTKYDIAVDANPYTAAADVASLVVKALGGKGNVLQVLGDPSAPTTVQEQQAWLKVFKNCPGIDLVGSATGEYETTVAKTATLQWLSTHPGTVNGVVQSAEMATGIMQAFQQAGQPVPVIGQIGGERGVMAYWLQHEASGYKGAAVTGGGGDFAQLIADVALRTLAGQGPKINAYPWPYGPVTNANLKAYVSPSWTTSSLGGVNNIPKYEWSLADLNKTFSNPTVSTGTK